MSRSSPVWGSSPMAMQRLINSNRSSLRSPFSVLATQEWETFKRAARVRMGIFRAFRLVRSQFRNVWSGSEYSAFSVIAKKIPYSPSCGQNGNGNKRCNLLVHNEMHIRCSLFSVPVSGTDFIPYGRSSFSPRRRFPKAYFRKRPALNQNRRQLSGERQIMVV